MKKIVIIAGSVLVVLIAAVGAFFWYSMRKPLYEPRKPRHLNKEKLADGWCRQCTSVWGCGTITARLSRM
ncbi:MAG: hypothetical protein ACE5I2_10495 [Anaerolineae bacterium]